MFFVHDKRRLKRLSAIPSQDEFVFAARKSMDELERLIQADRNAPSLHIDEGWDETSQINDAKSRS